MSDIDTAKKDANSFIDEALKKMFGTGATISELNGITPKEMDAVYNLGLSLYRTGQYEDADKVFQFLVIFDHMEQKYWIALGAVQQVKKNFKGAITSYGYAAFLDLKNPKPPYYSAECYCAIGDKENALEALDAIDQFCTDDTDVVKEFKAKAEELRKKINGQNT